MKDLFSDAALLIIGHGSTLNPASAEPTYQHGAELRRRGFFKEVREAFWKQEPAIQPVVASITAPRVFIVPLFTSAGYFTEEQIPTELGLRQPGDVEFARVQRRGKQTFYYCGPVGTHPAMAAVILSRAQEVLDRHPFPRRPKNLETALVLAGHGTARNANSRQAIEFQTERVRLLNRFAEVHAVFMEETPRIGECYDLTSVRNLVMVPFFISDGLHSYEDIPVLLGEPERLVRERLAKGQPTWRNPTEKKGKLVWYARSVGTDPQLAEVILDRVREAADMESESGRTVSGT